MGCSHPKSQFGDVPSHPAENPQIDAASTNAKSSDLSNTKQLDGATKRQSKEDIIGNTQPQKLIEGSMKSPIGPGMFITQQKAHLSDRYVRLKKLGSGAYGEVLLCREKQSGGERAIKIIKKTEITANVGTLLDEVAVVKQLDHPNIMKLYEFFEDNRNFYLVMEVYSGGELFDEIISKQKFTEVDAARIIKQVVSGVTYIHKYHIVHRDLKPENLLLESKAKDALIKIVDFGLSSHFDPRKKMKERLGT